MNLFRRILFGSVLAAAMSGSAMADQIVTYSASLGPQSTDFSFSGGTALGLQQFDPGSFGVPGDATLTGVSLELLVSETTTNLSLSNAASQNETFGAVLTDTVGVSGDSASGESVFVGTSVPLTIFSTGTLFGNPIQSLTLGPVGSGTCPTGTPSSSCNSVTYSNVTVGGNTGLVAIGSGFWSGYEGSGTFNISGLTISNTDIAGGGNNVTASVATNATVTAEVEYSYTEPAGTPEPTTMLLFGSALVTLGVVRKRARN